MSLTDETTIELSKKKLFLVIIGACVFVALGIWFCLLDDAYIQSQQRFNDPMYVRGIGLASIIFFGLCGIFAFIKLFDKKPGLIFSSAGLIDNASGVAAGLIPWSEVVSSEVFEIQKQKMLIIKVKNPKHYIDRGNAFKRMLNNANHKMCGSPIAISSNALKISFPELLSLFSQYQRKYGNA
jgi:hypothetical protein